MGESDPVSRPETHESVSPRRAGHPLGRRVARWAIVLAALFLIADFLLMPLVVALYATRPDDTTAGVPPPGFTAVAFPSPDGVRLAAWYAPPRNGAAVILLPGAGASRAALRAQAQLLAAQGFGVLALDPRGIGESDGRPNRFGWAGSSDVGGAIAFLSAQPGVQAIGGWGVSLGGEVLLGALGDYPQLTAVVADGATARSYEEKFALAAARGPFVQVYTRLMNRFLAWFSGDQPPVPLLDAIRASPTAELLLIAAGADDKEIAYNELFAATAGARATLWIVPAAEHSGAWDLYPEAYAQRVSRFFSEALRGSPSGD